MPIPVALAVAGTALSAGKTIADASANVGNARAAGPQDAYATWKDPTGRVQGFNPAAYNYAPGEADEYMRQAYNVAQQRAAITPDYSQAIGYMQQAGQVGGATDMYRNAALGTGYSAGQAQLAQGLQAQQANAQSMARSAGGGAYGQASAQGQVAMMDPAMRERGAQMAEMLRAQEMQQGMQGYANAAGDMRQRYGQVADAQSQLAQNTARMQLGQTQRNDAQIQFNENMRAQALGQQMSGSVQRTRDQAADANFITGLKYGTNQFNAGQSERNMQNAFGTAAAGAGMLGQYLSQPAPEPAKSRGGFQVEQKIQNAYDTAAEPAKFKDGTQGGVGMGVNWGGL